MFFSSGVAPRPQPLNAQRSVVLRFNFNGFRFLLQPQNPPDANKENHHPHLTNTQSKEKTP
jgi:hypothetical protein